MIPLIFTLLWKMIFAIASMTDKLSYGIGSGLKYTYKKEGEYRPAYLLPSFCVLCYNVSKSSHRKCLR